MVSSGVVGDVVISSFGGWLGGGWERLPICLCYVVLVGWLSGGGEWWGGVCVCVRGGEFRPLQIHNQIIKLFDF